MKPECEHKCHKVGLNPWVESCPICGCANPEYDPDEYEETEEDEDKFEPCSECDGHDACRDFGCAFKLGLGHMVRSPL